MKFVYVCKLLVVACGVVMKLELTCIIQLPLVTQNQLEGRDGVEHTHHQHQPGVHVRALVANVRKEQGKQMEQEQQLRQDKEQEQVKLELISGRAGGRSRLCRSRSRSVARHLKKILCPFSILLVHGLPRQLVDKTSNLTREH